jgi:putative ABC transport system permease protein
VLRHLRVLVAKCLGVVRRRSGDETFDEEVTLHLQLLEARYRERGMTSEDARREARRAFGGVQQLRETHRDATGFRWITEARQDVGYATRMLRRSPGFTAVAVLTLALGIGANTAVFSVVNAVILRPLPYPHPERIERVGWDWDGRSRPTGALAPFKFDYLRRSSSAFEALTTWQFVALDSGSHGSGGSVNVLRVSEDFFRAVGSTPSSGRAFTTAEYSSDGFAVCVLTHRSWSTRFGRDPDVVGRTLVVDERPLLIVGVMPATFEFPEVTEAADVLVPLVLTPDPRDLGANFPALGRVRQRIPREAVQSDLDRVFAQLRRDRPEQFSAPAERAVLVSFEDLYLADVRRPLWTLFAGVIVVLLIACTNVANLLLARGTTRVREMAVRGALGASRGRIVRQGITEGLVLASIGALCGVALGAAGMRALVDLAPAGIARLDQVRIDGVVLGFTLVLVTVTGVLFGLASTQIGGRGRPAGPTSLTTRGSSATRGSRRLRQTMIGIEAGLAMVLLVGAVFLVSAFYRLTHTQLGFDPHRVVAVTFSRTPHEYRNADRIRTTEQALRERLTAVPGVRGVATTSVAPLGERGHNIPITVDGRPEATEGAVEWRAVSREYASVMGLTLLRGRWFSEADAAAARPVMVVSSSFASRYWPDGNALGQRVWVGVFRGQRRPGGTAVPQEIIGIVDDIRDLGPTRPLRRTVFIPQTGTTALPSLLVRTEGLVSVETLRAAVADADPALPEPAIATLQTRLATRLTRERFSSVLITAFASVALLLTAIGVYGVVSWVVRHATHEIGIRMALGAGRSRVLREMLVRALAPVCAGLLIGGAVSFFASGLFSGLIVGATAVSLQVTGAAAAILIAAAIVAALIPARRASTVNPAVALRAE